MSFLEQASKAIREAGGRMTAQRRLIIELLAESDSHLDAEAVYHIAHERDAQISMATVYRTLNALEDAGLLQQRYLSRDHERKYYEPLHAESEYHFTCRICKRVIPFQSQLIQNLKAKLEVELGVSVMNACICFDGLCPECRDTDIIDLHPGG